MRPGRARALWLAALALVGGAILWAGLYPFERNPPNYAHWETGGGLRFQGRGVAWLNTPLYWPASDETGALTLAFWIRPEFLAPPGIPIALDDGSDPPLLEIGTSGKRVHLAWRDGDPSAADGPNGSDGSDDPNRSNAHAGRPHTRYLGRTDAFLPGGEHFVAIVSGRAGTRLYVDGELLESVTSKTSVIAPGEAFGGTLVIGCAGDGRRPWSGTLRSLVLYRSALGEGALLDIARALHARDPAALPEPAALWVHLPFGAKHADGAATSVANLGTARGELRVPTRFEAPRARVLSTYWSPGAGDVALNFLGFVPLGALLALGARTNPRTGLAARIRAVGLATLFAAALSLAIELLQVGMPSRDSSLYDWILNCAGAGAGATALVFRRIAAPIQEFAASNSEGSESMRS